jgi:hypothetical protein
MSIRSRMLAVAGAAVVLALIAGIYVLRAAGHHPRIPASSSISLARPGQLLFRDARTGMLAAAPLTGLAGSRTVSGLACIRVYASGGSGVCLTVERSAIPKIYAVILDRDLHPVRRISLAGAPSRAQVSASGRMVSWTVFVSGDSYTSQNLSTRTGILDARTGRVISTLEDFSLVRDGKRDNAPDHNYWGVTFTGDDDRFYATVRTRGTTYLVEGRMTDRTMRTVRKNVECPSTSPDGTRLVFKKATGDPSRPWRLHMLDLRTMRETPLAEPNNVDDQAAWLDDQTVIYGRVDGGTTDVWEVPADGTGASRLLIRNAFSPAVIH